MKNYLLNLLCFLFLVFSTYGCAMQSDLVDLENEVRRMKGILMETQRDVSIIQKSTHPDAQKKLINEIRTDMQEFGGGTKENLEMIQRNQADFEIRYDMLTTDLQVIQGKIEESNHRLTELSESVDDQERAIQDLSRRMDSIDSKMREPGRSSDKILLPGKDVHSDKVIEQIVQPETAVRPAAPSTPESQAKPLMPPPQPQQQVPAPPAPPPAADSSSSTLDPSSLYNHAYRDYMLGNYDLAISGFSDYLKQLPSGNLAPNALYWIGECYYSKGDYTKAVSVFESVTADYPKSNKVVSALLKIGYSFEKMGNRDMTISYFKKIVEQYPYSEEARLAKVRLAEIK